MSLLTEKKICYILASNSARVVFFKCQPVKGSAAHGQCLARKQEALLSTLREH